MTVNLLDNALKFGPAGGAVDVGVAADDDEVRLVVEDRGPGVSIADRERVFERFYRADTARAAPGSGLGLSIVDQIVRSHGGRATITDRPGGGASVCARLPGRTDPPADSPPGRV